MMPRIKPLLVLCAALLTVTPAASADVNSDMNQFFNKLGFASNTTQPGVWQGQAAGYAYGGSLYARTQVKNVQLISMTLPDINAGCGGIDAYLGSFSFINGEQLQRFVKQIMSNAAGYFFDLALQTTVPEIKTAKDFLQKMASDINSMNLSSCQAAQGIIGGLFPRTQVSQQKVCQDIAGESNIFADWAASRQGCTVGGKSDSVRDKASDKDKERVTKNINIMWNALSKNRMFDGNKELKEFVMTLTGSLVFGPNGEITPLSARTTDRSIIRAMMEGGTAKIYHCNDSDKCLKVVADTPVTISRDNALKSQITKLLASIQNKAVSDTPLDDKEKGFISSTTIPVFKYLVDPQMLGVSNSMIYQLAVFVLISLLVNVRTSVQVIDNSDLVKVHRVDNVPVGLAMPLSLTTRIGHAMVASYEMIFTQPDSVTYSKTGMLFGAELVSKSTDFLSRNPEITNLFQDYVQNCVMGDIYLNHKYTLEELMASADPYTLIFSRPSPLRGVYDSNNNFVTCKDASVSLKDKLNLDTQSGGKTWHYYAQQLFGGRPDPNLLFSTLIGDSYSYFYGSSKSASQIIRQNVTINALKEGITSYAARNGDSASLVNLATTSSMEKQRLAHVSIGHVAMRTLPMTQTILTGIAIGIFPLLVLAAVFNKLTLSVLKGYVFALMWLQSWPMLYAILNSAMTFYAKQNGAPVVLSEISQIQLKYSDLASTAGYLSMMIPPLSWMMVRGLGAGFSSVYSHFASSAISPTASAAGSVVDGNYSYGNMQTENVNGFSWSTNSTTSFGQMMYQTGSGATATQTRDGNMVMDASGAMSRLPVGINATRQIAAAQQEMAREASNRAESALHGFSSSIASAWNTLSQFGSNRGSSDSVTGGADSTMSAQDSMMASRMRSAVESYAKAHNISNEQATQELASTSTRLSGGMYADAHAEWGVKPKILGVGGGVGIRGGFKGSLDATDDDSHSASSGSRATHDARHDIDAKASKDFKEASDYFTSRKVSESGSHTDNNADSRVDQLSAALNSAKQSYDQYTTNMTRSHEYAEMASRTESMSGQMSEDLSQQFALYVMKHAPQDAEAILTNTSSPEIAERRRAMAWSFVQEQVQPGVDNAWRESRGDIGKGMESVPSGGGSQDIIADHQGHQAIIDQRTQDSNIRNDVKHQVDNMVTEYKGNIGDTQNSIHGEENIVDRQYSELKNNHKQEEIQQNNRYNEENKRQKLMPTPSEDALKQMVDDKKERLKGPL
ncbi:conjugal transfer mating pair stabilization protein TraG [Escherichia coli]|nr:conjugal transfer mating pair stabilization protein TraG [Escherichia coli]HCC7007545.1 conjugal transfer mating pair stabilization protein TraG [Escherichia coli]